MLLLHLMRLRIITNVSLESPLTMYESEVTSYVSGIRLLCLEFCIKSLTLWVTKANHVLNLLERASGPWRKKSQRRLMHMSICSSKSVEYCEDQGMSIEVKITAGIPIKNVILQEVRSYKAAWVILDRHLRRDLRLYIRQIPCKVALVQDNLNVDVLRNHTISETGVVEHKLFYSMSKPVPLSNFNVSENISQSEISVRSYSLTTSSSESYKSSHSMPSITLKSEEHNFSSVFGSSSKQEKSDTHIKGENKLSSTLSIVQKQQRSASRNKCSGSPLLCVACGLTTELYIQDSMAFSYSEIQQATDDFSKKNLLGEGGYGRVYKGKLKDGLLIAAKVRKQDSTQGFAEFISELCVLSFAHHKNIVMLLGYCCKENLNILVYEYVCNKSLHWHLFVGTAKGLHFLHEECRGGPIIHRDMRPSNILLTHDLVPMLGDFGLARWKINDDTLQTRVLGTLGNWTFVHVDTLPPEYAEHGFVSVRTDVYAFGIVLLQLISGRRVIDLKSKGRRLSLQQWAEPLIEKLALVELIDPRIRESYDTHQLYLMAQTAYLYAQRSPEMRPSMRGVLHLLEGESDHFHHLKEKFVPH
ncbi:hypothetical protein PTKIN_Ptkin09bG0169600 [Pterospermum kingtungense]